MKVQFVVTVNIGRRDAQPISEFKKEDGKDFIPYLSDKIREAVADSYQHNAMVNTCKVSRKRTQK